MNTQRKKTNPLKAVATVLILAGLTPAIPVRAQLNSQGASVALVATVPASVTLQHRSVPMPGFFAEGEAPFEVLQVYLQWRLQPGLNLQIQPTVVTETQTRPLLPASGYVGMKQFTLASFAYSFQPPAGTSGVVLGAVADSEEKPIGRASFLVAAPRAAEREQTIHISIAVL